MGSHQHPLNDGQLKVPDSTKKLIKERLELMPNMTPTDMERTLLPLVDKVPTRKQLANLMYRFRNSKNSNNRGEVWKVITDVISPENDSEAIPISMNSSNKLAYGGKESPFYAAFSSKAIISKCSSGLSSGIPAVFAVDGMLIMYSYPSFY